MNKAKKAFSQLQEFSTHPDATFRRLQEYSEIRKMINTKEGTEGIVN